jgi:ATP-binding protein involved in chromosome partitioning
MSQTEITEAQVLDALRPIVDPDFRRSIVDLGFVKDIQIEGGQVAFKIELTTPACPVKAEFERQAHEAVSGLAGVTQVEVTMTANTRGSQRQTEENILPGVKNIIAVASGKGGVGKSTTAVNLALAFRETGATVGLMDADIYGPSIPLMLGVGGPPKVTPDRKIVPKEAHGLRLMSIGFLAGDDAPVIWRGPMVHQSAPLSGAVIVTTPQEVALIDARKGLKMFQRVNVPVLGIVENMSYFECPDCHSRHSIFGEGGGARASKELGVDLLIQVPIQPDVVQAGDEGKPTIVSNPESPAAKAFGELAGTVARKLAILGAEAPPILDSNIEWVNNPS